MFKSIRKHIPDSHPVIDVLTIVIKAVSRSMARDVMLFAGGASYFGMLALFPAMALAMSVYGLTNDVSDVEAQIARFAGIMPQGAQDFVLNQMARLAVAPISALSVNGAIALAIALFAASRGVKAVIAGLNHLAEDQDIRNVIHFNILAMGSVLIGGMMLTLANLAVLAIPVLLRKVFVLLGLEPLDFGGLVNEWTAAALVMFVALELLYRMTMRRRSEAVSWRASTVAALVSTGLWLGLSKGFSLYVGQVIDFGVYGSLGALVVFLLWIYWSAYAVFFGGALAIEIDARYGTRRDRTTG
ncbi:YihY/virulence factor BrkB family protein [Maricaulis sp.]|uniref:YihY/virulence factor BrkB family protein n=1 Tax=Maricaulis sp. TaxID=1486257 RepID=UPI001B26180A|nr:YihY/virulence factor BrkB family protein [Maricaulis sp.]MBO6765713.1 YihY/virulence factor BrkB family protein [Maricaulis sp.]